MSKEKVLDGFIPLDIPDFTVEPEEEQEDPKDFPVPKKEVPVDEAEEEEDGQEEEAEEAPDLEEYADSVEGVFSLFKEFDFIGEEDIPENPTVEDVLKLRESLSERFLEAALGNAPPALRDLLFFAYSKDNPTKEDLLQFLEVESPLEDLPDVSTPEEAEAYLRRELAGNRLYKKNPDSLQLYLDSLEDDEKLELAQGMLKEKEEEVEGKKREQIETARRQKQQMQEQQMRFLQEINKNIDESGWAKSRKEEVKSIIPRLEDYNRVILSDPGLYAQYLAFMSTLDLEKKQFDTSRYEARKNSQDAISKKEGIQADGITSVLNKFRNSKPAASGKRDTLVPL